MGNVRREVAIVRILAVLLPLLAFGQTPNGSISGVVQDPSGAVIPGAKVTVTDTDTGVARSTATDNGGRYRVTSLIPDHYTVQAEREGFTPELRSGIQLAVGADLDIGLSLQVGKLAQETVVNAEAPMVETLNGTISGLVDDAQMRDLPLNARSFDQLIGLDSSAPKVRMTTASATNGASATYSVHGARDQQNRLLLDGQSVIGASNGTPLPGGVLGLNLGVEAILEFSLLTSDFDAEYGRKSGGIVNMATRSGSNSFHGSLFEFLRNSDLDARNFFDVQIPPYRRNQFGGSVGGPIQKNKLFFFFNYEGLRQVLGLSVVEDVPDLNARQGFLPGAGGALTNVGVAASVAPYLATFPLPNGPELGGGVAEAIFSPSQKSNVDFYLGRVDYHLSDRDTLFARYTYSPQSTAGTSSIIYWMPQNTSDLQDFELSETRAVAATVNTVRLGVNRSYLHVNTVPTVPVSPSLGFFPGAGAMGSIAFTSSSVSSAASGGSLTADGPPNSPLGTFGFTEFTLGDTVSHIAGPHTLQFGFEIDRDYRNTNSPTDAYGVFNFPSLTSFLQGTPSTFTAPNVSGGDSPAKSYQNNYYAAYVQDDYRALRRLTINLGLRWEFMSVPTEKYDRISNYLFQYVNGLTIVNTSPTLGNPYYAPDHTNFAPRLGIAWDPWGDGKTSVRAGFGMFYDQIETEYGNVTNSNLPYFGLASASNPPFPLGFSGSGATAPLPAPGTISPTLSPATRIQYNFSIQRQITPNTVVMVDYVGSHAYNLTYRTDLNTIVPQVQSGGVLFFPSTGSRANPALAASQFLGTGAGSSYQGLDFKVTRRLSKGLRAQGAFTWSKSIDNASDTISSQAIGAPTLATVWNNLQFDRGLSSFDVGRNLVVNFTYDIPAVGKGSGFAGQITKGWQLSGLLTLADGMPFTVLTGFNRSNDKSSTTVDRPNLAPGITYGNIILGKPSEYFNPNVFVLPPAGYLGNVGRNTLIGPGFATLDSNLSRIFVIREGIKLDFRAEFFNLFNRANFGLPSDSVFTSTGAIQSNAGQITSTVSTSRQIQFALKLLF